MRFHNQEFFIDIQSDDKAVPYFINTDDQTFISSAVSVFRKIGVKLSFYYYWSFPRRIFLSKVSAKYCTCAINNTIVLTWTRLGDRLDMNKTWVIQLKLANLPTAFKKFADKNQEQGSQSLEPELRSWR